MCNEKERLAFGLEIGRNIRRLRLERKMTQEQLAEAVNCHPDKISQYELGKLQPDTYFLQTLADYFNVPLSDILPTKGVANHEKRQAN